jgi:hypothetical protein
MCRQFPGFYLILLSQDSQEREPKNTTSGRQLIRFGPFSNIFRSPLLLDILYVDYVVLKM